MIYPLLMFDDLPEILTLKLKCVSGRISIFFFKTNAFMLIQLYICACICSHNNTCIHIQGYT